MKHSAVFFIFLLSIAIKFVEAIFPSSFLKCEKYLLSSLTQILLTKNITDSNLYQTLILSGRTWNDQGDVQGCLNQKNMTFVEVTIQRPDGEAFRGLCISDVCDYETLEENKESLQLISDNLKFGFNMTQVTFSGSSPIYPSKTSASFLIMILSISMVVAFNLIGAIYYLWSQSSYSFKRRTTTSTVNSDCAQSSQSEESLGKQVLSTFDIISNTKKLFVIKSSNNDLNVFNGIRTISFLQVVFGHEFFARLSYMQNPGDLVRIVESHPIYLFVANCLYSVDVFFLLGGFFIAYVAADPKLLSNFHLKKPKNATLSFVLGLLNRLFRIFPAYFIALMIYWQLLPFLGDSPTWQRLILHTEECEEVWWQKVLFIDNIIKAKSKCFGWAWYLSNDLQMYLYSMVLIMIYATHKTAGKWSMVVSILGFNAYGTWIAFQKDLLIPVTANSFFMNLGDSYYYKPWARCPPYFFGLLFGIWYKEYQIDKQNKTSTSFLTKMSKKIGNSYWKLFVYFLGLGLIFGLILIPRPIQEHGQEYWSHSFQNFWYGNMRLVYGIGICLVCLPGMCGSNDLIVKVLSCKIFAFLARLSFSGYLVHYIVIAYNLWNSFDAMYFSFEGLFGLFLTEIIFVLIAGFLLHIIVEQPVMGLANIIFSKSKGGRQRVDSSALSLHPKTISEPLLKVNFESTMMEQDHQDSLLVQKQDLVKISEKDEEDK